MRELELHEIDSCQSNFSYFKNYFGLWPLRIARSSFGAGSSAAAPLARASRLLNASNLLRRIELYSAPFAIFFGVFLLENPQKKLAALRYENPFFPCRFYAAARWPLARLLIAASSAIGDFHICATAEISAVAYVGRRNL